MSLYLYLVSQSTNTNPNAYTSAVVIAASDNDAKFMHPINGCQWELNQWKDHADLWVHPDEVEVKLLGVAALFLQPGSVLAATENF